MNCYVVCENHYVHGNLSEVQIIGACETIEAAKGLIESNKEELRLIFNGSTKYDFTGTDGHHDFETEYGDRYRTCAVRTEFVAKEET